MKIGKKLLMIGLSTLMMITPCFAQSKIAIINGQQVILDLDKWENRNYIRLGSELNKENLLKYGYEYYYNDYDEYDNPEVVTIIKNNKALTLSKEKGEIKSSDAVPLAMITNYFGDSLEIPVSKLKENFLDQVDTVESILYLSNIAKEDIKEQAQVKAEQLYTDLMQCTIDELYYLLLKKLPEAEKQQLEQEQRAWQIYKTNNVNTLREKCHELILQLP